MFTAHETYTICLQRLVWGGVLADNVVTPCLCVSACTVQIVLVAGLHAHGLGCLQHPGKRYGPGACVWLRVLSIQQARRFVNHAYIQAPLACAHSHN
jgi:hypothetical protein